MALQKGSHPSYPHALKSGKGSQGSEGTQSPQRLDGAYLGEAQGVGHQADKRDLWAVGGSPGVGGSRPTCPGLGGRQLEVLTFLSPEAGKSECVWRETSWGPARCASHPLVKARLTRPGPGCTNALDSTPSSEATTGMGVGHTALVPMHLP